MIEAILNFWFDYDNNSKPLYNRAAWWQKNEQLDNRRKCKELCV